MVIEASIGAGETLQPVVSPVVFTREGKRFADVYPGIVENLPVWQRNVPFMIFSYEDEERSPMKRLASGGQAEVFVLGFGGQEYVYKVRREGAQRLDRELLQIIELQNAVGERLHHEAGVRLPVCLLATADTFLREYVQGGKLASSDDRLRMQTAHTIVASYIEGQQQVGNSLWEGVVADGMYPKSPELPHISNFVWDQDNALVWIDPVLYYPQLFG